MLPVPLYTVLQYSFISDRTELVSGKRLIYLHIFLLGSLLRVCCRRGHQPQKSNHPVYTHTYQQVHVWCSISIIQYLKWTRFHFERLLTKFRHKGAEGSIVFCKFGSLAWFSAMTRLCRSMLSFSFPNSFRT